MDFFKYLMVILFLSMARAALEVDDNIFFIVLGVISVVYMIKDPIIFQKKSSGE